SVVDFGLVDAAADGGWIVAGGRYGEWLARIDPETFEVLRFSDGGLTAYGPYANPQNDIAISNDGRYAALTGGLGEQKFRLYDLSTCTVPEPDWNMSAATDCESKDLEGYMKQQVPGFAVADHLEFNADGTQLTFTARIDGQLLKQVTLTAAPQKRLDYLALGDSFSSGEGDKSNYEYGTDG
ncbi:MAG: hypothetical protein ACREQV_07620, partial [Candidatus Binatia bacterium]